ncbi:MAG: cell division protein ZapA [Firmicutes bacterium]|nr:cell division protein ZapA [Bacillota bacterium]
MEEDTNKVTVKIYGQEYTIAGEQSREHIMKVADLVDSKMNELSAPGTSLGATAVLAALNIADDYFTKDEDVNLLLEQNLKLEADTKKYESMWEELKQSFAKYKEEVAAAGQQRELVERRYMEKEQQYREKDQQISQLTAELSETRKHNDVLRLRIEDLNAKINTMESAPEASLKQISDLEAKCRDLESSFFDIQMENIHLKNELENYKRR